jgi:hypothetical protein
VLDAVVALRRNTGSDDSPVSAASPAAAAAVLSGRYAAKVRAAEATVVVPSKDHRRALRLSGGSAGWRIKLGHRTLVDLTPMDAAAVRHCPFAGRCALSAVLPTAGLFRSDGELPDPAVAVASPSLLVHQLGASLRSGCVWRIKKDVVRLRLISQAAWMERLTHIPAERQPQRPNGHAHQHQPPQQQPLRRMLADVLGELKVLLGEFDPSWLRFLTYMDSAHDQYLSWAGESFVSC